MNWLKWPLEHYSISLLIIGILFVLGIYGMYVMPKDEFPAFTIRQGVVVAVYPGATRTNFWNTDRLLVNNMDKSQKF